LSKDILFDMMIGVDLALHPVQVVSPDI